MRPLRQRLFVAVAGFGALATGAVLLSPLVGFLLAVVVAGSAVAPGAG